MTSPAPNHHASHPGFSGASGLFAAVSFLFGRDRAAELAIDVAALQPGERLVDVGCGPGVAVHHARSLGATAIGVDPAPVMLRVARARWRATPAVQWRLGTAEGLPVEDGWANVVWSLSTVHHWHDVDRSLAEARRVLAPGGRLVTIERRITDINADGSASHGWQRDQADSFAELCTRHGFVRPAVGEHTGKGTVLSVVAHAG
ncbi:MAG: class I SAM-dependent methyltransferase [Acidimicrobiaceae bacterium]|nr:class I SAM-dependent methyltransferase [Ilumatobacter sp.]MCB9382128.1 class I SAM-dependent methyltransferase [Acidimicrobiaceae bacterium]MCO5330882.1 class I SAM-dependent methyltransferase [Ilumatobacteraceae bacterium]